MSGGDVITTKQRTHDGDTTLCQSVTLAGVTGTEDSYTFTDVQTGGGTEAAALRVTLANDSTGVVSVDDNGGALTVDNAGTFAVQVDGDALTALQTIDNIVVAEDAVHNTGDSGVMALGVRQDTQSDFGADGDYVPLSVDANGAVRVNAINAGGTSNVDTAAGATDEGAVMLAIRDDALTTLTPVDGDYVGLRVNSTGALHVTGGGGGTEYTVNTSAPADPTGTASLMERDDALSALTEIEGDWTNMRSNANGALWTAVDGTVTVDGSGVTQPVSGTITANLGADDNAVLDQIEVNTSYGDSVGGGTEAAALRVTIANDSTGVLSVDDNGGALTVDNGGTFATQVDGAALTALQLIDNPIVAHDAAATGSTGVNMAGARATNSVEGITQVANGDATRVQADLNGVLLSRPHTTLEEVLAGRVVVSTSASTAVTNFGAGGVGIHNYITTISVANVSGTSGRIDISNASASANGPFWTTIAPASGGSNITFDPPLKQPTANAALHVKADVSVNAIYVSFNGFQAQG